MKNKLLSGALIPSVTICALLLSACSLGADKKAASANEQETPATTIVIGEESDETASQSNTAGNDEQSSPAQAAEDSESAAAGSQNATLLDGDLGGVVATGTAKGVIYTSEDFNETLAADDGFEYFKCEYQVPSIEIKDNVPAAAAINDYILSSVESYRTDIDLNALEAESFYNMTLSEDDIEPSGFPYTLTSDFQPARLDGKIVSLCELAYSYTGGAHGTTVKSGYNFDASTGNLLTLSSIAVDPARLKSSAKEYILEALSGPQAEDYMLFDNYESSIDYVFDEGSWYMTDNGVVFIAGQYLIAPFSSGILEFEVPYSRLESLNEAYLP